MSVMQLGHLLTVPVSRIQKFLPEVCHDSFCQLGNSVSLPWVIYFEAFYLHVVSSYSCIPAVCLEPVLFQIPLQCVNLFCNLSQVYPAVLLMYFIAAAVILLASLALTVHKFHCHITRLGGPVYCVVLFLFSWGLFCGLNTLFIIPAIFKYLCSLLSMSNSFS